MYIYFYIFVNTVVRIVVPCENGLKALKECRDAGSHHTPVVYIMCETK